MTDALRLIGYWDGPVATDGLPDVCAFVDADAYRPMRQRVAAYLRSGTVFIAAAGVSICRLCGAANGSAELTDGEHFAWPEGLAHYVEEHGVRLPDEFTDLAVRGAAPFVDPERLGHLLRTGALRIDLGWWRSLPGTDAADPAIDHLRGCRHSGTPAGWELPTSADIFVDRVPPDAVAIIVQIRRLLGASWPFASLRGLLDQQPFLAATGNPLRLHRILASSPELRPYLFYGAADGPAPVWSDT
ncbi:hypothetical protein [Hamadaea tsunoensis]|uniref:hypothetical protein n=1 Tax=Hamadaea tsunoensis TaxID=53368 RepID=UPI0004034AB0|nr:hypothetical protein [Hamadaea tsunoensis]